MTSSVWIWLAVSIAFEAGGDYLVKSASLAHSKGLWLLSLAAYNLMLVAWMLAIRAVKEITIPGTVWLVLGQLVLVIVGVGIFGELLTIAQKIGIGLSIVALVLLSL